MAKTRDEDVAERAVSDFPKHPLESATRVPAILEELNGGRPLPPAEIAIGLGLSPGSSDFRVLLSASLKFGLTTGTYKSDRIAMTELGRRVAAPISEEDRVAALVVAAQTPDTFRRLFSHFNGKKLPEDGFFQNTIVREFGVPREHAAKCSKIFRANAEFIGCVREASTGQWLVGAPIGDFQTVGQSTSSNKELTADEEKLLPESDVPALNGTMPPRSAVPPTPDKKVSRVFISHGRNMEIVGQIKTMLNVAEISFEVAVEQESTAIPVPDKVFSAMRNCNSAIICVTADGPAEAPHPINQNVLIEIGAAFVLYDKKVILVWDKRLTVPSNLQGLYRCEFEGNELSWSKGMKLLEAIKQFKN